jgi:hypothetical protein
MAARHDRCAAPAASFDAAATAHRRRPPRRWTLAGGGRPVPRRPNDGYLYHLSYLKRRAKPPKTPKFPTQFQNLPVTDVSLHGGGGSGRRARHGDAAAAVAETSAPAVAAAAVETSALAAAAAAVETSAPAAAGGGTEERGGGGRAAGTAPARGKGRRTAAAAAGGGDPSPSRPSCRGGGGTATPSRNSMWSRKKGQDLGFRTSELSVVKTPSPTTRCIAMTLITLSDQLVGIILS